MSPRKQPARKHEPKNEGKRPTPSPKAKSKTPGPKPTTSAKSTPKRVSTEPSAALPASSLSASMHAAASTHPAEQSHAHAVAHSASTAHGAATQMQVAAATQPQTQATATTTSTSQRERMTLPKVHAPEFDGLPTEEIWELYRKARKGGPKRAEEVERLRNVLMERHYPLVRYIAERLLQTLPKSIELDDLVSAGLFGLMDAIRGFDPDRNIKFKTYCTTRIRGSILDQLRSQDWVPRLVRLKAGRIDKALQKLTGEYGREPTHAELASALKMEHGELAMEISSASAKTMFSLSEKWEDRDDDSSIEKVDVLEDRKATDPIGELHRRDMMLFLTKSLTHKERFIIEQYYQVGHTMREIGEMLALTESRVCQIHSNVMGRLKGLLGQKSGTLLM